MTLPRVTCSDAELPVLLGTRNMQLNCTFRDALSSTVFITSLFNSKARARTRCASFAERALFVLVFFALCFVAVLGVFVRSGIDTWIQFSLYVVPLHAMICGHLIFKARPFKELLNRRMVKSGAGTGMDTSNNLYSFLRKRSLKTCFYPLSLVLYQWTVYLLFFYQEGSSNFSGRFNTPRESSYVTRSLHLNLNQEIWLPLYYTFWTVAMYVTGFVGCCFMLVSDIHKLDVNLFMWKMGNGPLVKRSTNSDVSVYSPKTRRTTNHGGYEEVNTMVSRPVGLFIQLVSLIAGFLSLGLMDFASKPLWETQHIEQPGYSGTYIGNTQEFASEICDSGVGNGLSSGNENEASTSADSGGRTSKITPKEASRLLLQLVSSIETNCALFKPFLVLLTFFSVTNVVTHVVAMTHVVGGFNDFTDLHWWTLARSLFWFMLAVRLLWTVATITRALSRIIPHICYLRSVGELPGAKHEWDIFFQLAETFRFGSRTYGFPLTLNQVASIVAVINFSFLIVLSLISKTQK